MSRRTMRAAIAAMALLVAVPSAAQAVDQPSQPTSGPGSSAYPSKSFTVTPGGRDNDAWIVLEPADPAPATAPLAIVTHGYGDYAGYDQMAAFAQHTAKTGSVVVYPRWQTGFVDPCPGPFDIEPCMTSWLNGVRGALAFLKDNPDHVQPDLDRTSYFGFSFGGIITANALNRTARYGLPIARAVFLDDPHDGGFTGAREPALDPDLGGIPSSALVVCHSGAHGVFDDPYNGGPNDLTEQGQPKKDGTCNAVFPKLTSIAPEHKDLVLTSEDAHGTPALTSDHGVCAGPNGGASAVDAYDWGFCWKQWDALRACALTQTLCSTALGDTPAHRFIGLWSDGVPIVGLKIQAAAPIRADPVPDRAPAPAATPAAADRAPRARITGLVRRRGAIVAVRGTASDDDAVKAVRAGVVRRTSAGCRRLTASGRFKAMPSCAAATTTLRTRGTTTWSLRLPKRLAAGRYRVEIRAVDTAGQSQRRAARRGFNVGAPAGR